MFQRCRAYSQPPTFGVYREIPSRICRSVSGGWIFRFSFLRSALGEKAFDPVGYDLRATRYQAEHHPSRWRRSSPTPRPPSRSRPSRAPEAFRVAARSCLRRMATGIDCLMVATCFFRGVGGLVKQLSNFRIAIEKPRPWRTNQRHEVHDVARRCEVVGQYMLSFVTATLL